MSETYHVLPYFSLSAQTKLIKIFYFQKFWSSSLIHFPDKLILKSLFADNALIVLMLPKTKPTHMPDIDLTGIKAFSILIFSCIFEGKPVSSGFDVNLSFLNYLTAVFVSQTTKITPKEKKNLACLIYNTISCSLCSMGWRKQSLKPLPQEEIKLAACTLLESVYQCSEEH